MISEVEILYGTKKEFKLILDVNFLCVMDLVTLKFKGGSQRLRFDKNGILLLDKVPVTNKDLKTVKRTEAQGITSVVWEKQSQLGSAGDTAHI